MSCFMCCGYFRSRIQVSRVPMRQSDRCFNDLKGFEFHPSSFGQNGGTHHLPTAWNLRITFRVSDVSGVLCCILQMPIFLTLSMSGAFCIGTSLRGPAENRRAGARATELRVSHAPSPRCCHTAVGHACAVAR